MAANAWTHPTHKFVAFIATIMGLISMGLAGMSMVGIKFFTRKKGGDSYTLISDVTCNDTSCTGPEAKGESCISVTGGTYLIMGGVGLEAMGLVLLLLVFWPVCLAKGVVLNMMLRIIQYVDFVGDYLVFGGTWLMIIHSPKVNDTYRDRWQYDNHLLQMESLPLGLLLLSFVAEMLCVMGLNISRDVGVDGKTHLERLEKEKEAEEMHKAETMEMRKRRKSSYEPDQTTRHSIILSRVGSKHG